MREIKPRVRPGGGRLMPGELPPVARRQRVHVLGVGAWLPVTARATASAVLRLTLAGSVHFDLRSTSETIAARQSGIKNWSDSRKG